MADFPRPRPAPPPGRTAAPRPTRINGADMPRSEQRQQLTPDQYARVQTLRIAVDRHRGKHDATDEEILATAQKFAEFVRTGHITKEDI